MSKVTIRQGQNQDSKWPLSTVPKCSPMLWCSVGWNVSGTPVFVCFCFNFDYRKFHIYTEVEEWFPCPCHWASVIRTWPSLYHLYSPSLPTIFWRKSQTPYHICKKVFKKKITHIIAAKTLIIQLANHHIYISPSVLPFFF